MDLKTYNTLDRSVQNAVRRFTWAGEVEDLEGGSLGRGHPRTESMGGEPSGPGKVCFPPGKVCHHQLPQEQGGAGEPKELYKYRGAPRS